MIIAMSNLLANQTQTAGETQLADPKCFYPAIDEFAASYAQQI